MTKPSKVQGSMQTVEITAKTVQEATHQAAEKLGVSPDRVQVTVLEETKGLFGKSSVRVRAEATEETVAPAPAEVAPVAPAAKGGRGKKANAPTPGPTPKETIAEVQAAVDETPAPEPTAKSNGRRGRGKKVEAAPVQDSAPVAEPEVVEAEVSEQLVATQDDADQLVALVRELLEAAQLNVNAKFGSIAGRYVNITLDGKDAAFLVGKHGEVLNAMQYLVNIVAGRRFDNGIRATLDGNDYRRRREEALTQLAVKIAEQVKQRGEEAVLDALPAFERRIVHKALGEVDGITTYSEGEEPNRRVVIAPAD